MNQDWICVNEEQKKIICEKQKEIMRTSCKSTMIKSVIFGIIAVLLAMLIHQEKVDEVCYNNVGFNRYSSSRPMFYSYSAYSEKEQEEYLAARQAKLKQAYKEARAEVFPEYLPLYILIGVVVCVVICGRIIWSYVKIKRFEKNPLFIKKMRVVGKIIYQNRYNSHTTLTLKGEDGKTIEDVHSYAVYELEPEDMVILIKTPLAYDIYEAAYPAAILKE